MSSKVNFGFKRSNRPKNNLKTTPKEFLEEQYIDLTQNQPNKKRTRE